MTLRERRWIGGFGLVFIALFIGSGALVTQKSAHTSAAAIAAFYPHHVGAMKLQAHLTGLAVFLGIGIFWYLRELIGSTPAARRLATLGFAGVLVFAFSGALSGGLERTIADVATHATPSTIQTLHILYVDTADLLAAGGVAMFLVATGLAVTRGTVLPHWLGWLGIPLGVLALVALDAAGAIAALWTLIVSVVLLVSRNAPRAAEAGAPQ